MRKYRKHGGHKYKRLQSQPRDDDVRNGTEDNIAFQDQNWRAQICAFAVMIIVIVFVVFILVYSKENWLTFDNQDSYPVSKADIKNIKCKSEICKSVTEVMNLTQNPCDDFYNFACGNWKDVYPKFKGRQHWTAFARLDMANKMIIRRGLAGKRKSQHTSKISKKMRKFYRLCQDRNKLTLKKSKREMLQVLGEVSYQLSAKHARSDLASLLAELFTLYGVQPFFKWIVGINDKESTKHIMKIDQADLILGPGEHFKSSARGNSAMREYLGNVTQTFGLINIANKFDSHDIIDRVVKLERNLNEILLTPAAHMKHVHDPRFVTLSELDANSTFMDWNKFSTLTIRSESGKTMKPGTSIIVSAPSYIEGLNKILSEYLETREGRAAVSLYCALAVIDHHLDFLSTEFRSLKLAVKSNVLGVSFRKSQKISWQTCVRETETVFGQGLGRIFIEETGGTESSNSEQMLEMVHQIRGRMKDNFRNNPWMDDDTKQAAITKAKMIQAMIGFSDTLLDKDKLYKMYENVKIVQDSYLFTKIDIQSQKKDPTKMWKRLQKDVPNSKWISPPQKANAYYSPVLNEIVVPEGILQLPFYSASRPQVMNYGGIGFTIGHELTHAFDNNGRKYDGHGNLKDWWGRSAEAKFKERAKCIVNQFNNYSLFNIPVNGRQTLEETIADNGGIRATWDAFFTSNLPKTTKGSFPVPDLPFTDEQLFFLSFSQVWCADNSKEYEIEKLRTNSHPPSQFRVLAALSNMPEFSTAFSCPSGTKMNPSLKCSLW